MITKIKPDDFRVVQKVAGGLIVVKEKILLLKRSPLKIFGANQWAIPGGKLEDGETFIQGMQRELQEEIGVTFQLDQISKSRMYYHVSSSDTTNCLEYSLSIINLPEQPVVVLNSEESVTYDWFSFEEIKKLDLIEDALYCITDIIST